MKVSTDSTIQTNNMYNYLDPTTDGGGNSSINISAVLIVALVVIGFAAFFLSLGNNNQETSQEGSSGSTIGIGMIMFLIFIIVIGGINYFYGSTMTTYIKNFFIGKPTIQVDVKQDIEEDEYIPPPPAPTPQKDNREVFNIPGNYFSYTDAKSICKAYGARLASYDEVENAYNDGAEWCAYGWSKGQMALFPTQKDTFNKLQETKEHKNDCGRPGINGGYMANPHLQFGVNCYGIKPYITEEEEQLMSVSTPYPKTEKDIQFEEKVNYWKNNLNEILVAPFNRTSWNKI